MTWHLIVIHVGMFIIGILLEDLYGITDKVKSLWRYFND